MPLNIISNFAANVAHRNLVATDAAATNSLAKLSSGTRVVGAKDDAASLAIGKRLSAEIDALRAAQVNAGQASSMMQIADGALSTISDILTRMKSLAVQSSSGQLSSTERTLLNDEFVSLRNEIDRIAGDTEFNGTALINGSNTFASSSVGTNIQVADGFEQFSFGAAPGGTFVSSGDTIAVTFTSATNTLTLTNEVTNSTQSVATDAPSAGAFENAVFGDFGITVQLNSLFDTGSDIAAANSKFVVAGGTSNNLSLSYRVGTGTGSNDVISLTLEKADSGALSANLDTSIITTVTDSETAITRLSTAIDKVNEIRADVGAAQNRIEFAASNLGSSIENAEAARSNLLDLDVAQEMSTFTSKQVLLQAGISMLAQANALPQNLLKLLG